MSRTGLCVTAGVSAVLLSGLAGFEMNSLWSVISGQSLMTLLWVLGHTTRALLTVNFVQFYLVWVVGLGLLGTTVATATRAERWGWRVGLPAALTAVVFGLSVHPIEGAWIIGRLIGPLIWAVALSRIARHSANG